MQVYARMHVLGWAKKYAWFDARIMWTFAMHGAMIYGVTYW